MRVEYKIVHIFDDAIISNSTIELYKKIEGFSQTFAVITLPDIVNLGKVENDDSIIRLNYSSNLTNEIANLIESHDIVIFQALSFEKAKATVQKRFSSKVFIWGLWGYELYNLVDHFQPNTNNSYATEIINSSSFKQKIIDFYTYRWIYSRAIKKIDFCLFLLESDFNLLKKVVKTNARWYTSCYQTIENLFGETGPFEVTGNSILIGNSSTPSNRHSAVFKSLSTLDLTNEKIVVPLSYGDATYGKSVIAEGEILFKENFSPITTYMNLEQYIDHLKECSHVIFGHQRQQAFGTILMMVYAGSKVYLSTESPLYNWFKSKNVHIYSIETDLNRTDFANFPENLKKENKEIIGSLVSEETILDQLTTLLQDACQLFENKFR